MEGERRCPMAGDSKAAEWRETRAMTAIPALTPTAIGKPPPKADPHRRYPIFTPFPFITIQIWHRVASSHGIFARQSFPHIPSITFHLRRFPNPQLVIAHQHRSSLDISTGVTSILAFQTLQPTAQTSEMDGTTLRAHTTVTAYRLSDMTL